MRLALDIFTVLAVSGGAFFFLAGRAYRVAAGRFRPRVA